MKDKKNLIVDYLYKANCRKVKNIWWKKSLPVMVIVMSSIKRDVRI